MSDVIITVRGSGEARVAPERAVAHVSASVDGPDRGGVVEQIAALAAPVREDLAARKAAGTIEDWAAQRVSIWSDRPWNNEGRQLDLVHHASVEITATFADFVALSDWLNQIAVQDGVHVGAVDWQLTPATRAATERDVATAAVTVAVERATAYAAAIGRASVTPLEIADLGLLTPGQDAAPSPRMFAKASMSMDAAASPAIDFQPDEIVITAAVEARFSAHPSTGSGTGSS